MKCNYKIAYLNPNQINYFIITFFILFKLSNDLGERPQFITDSTGKITGYKTPGGADTVFPFSNLQKDEGTFSTYVLGKQYQSVTVTFNKAFKEPPDFGAFTLSNNLWIGISTISSLTKTDCTFHIINRDEAQTATIKWIAVGEVQ